MPLTGQQKFEEFRRKHSFLSYEGFDTSVTGDGIKVQYHFNLSDSIHFHPGFTIPVKTFFKKAFSQQTLELPYLRNILFHIGMIELISYWKAACPKHVIIKTGILSEPQVQFWKKIYFMGLGEFFYTNAIQTNLQEFMTIESAGPVYEPVRLQLNEQVIVPIGGGKDSVVTLEILKKEFEVRPFILNPRGASLETCFKAGFANNMIAEINRTLDPQLLKLNSEGYLNGHTPFSALLAFYTLLISALTGYKHIALSNESSANEATVSGTDVNHQYSKSYDFEQDFRSYVSSFISEDLNYFSFLRPLSELQIAKLFAQNVKYYHVFKSCNVGSKTDTWCGTCPKCLFAWTILSPFIPVNELEQIFGKNLFEEGSMIRYLKELTGIDEVKPFECVGTVEEVNISLQLFIRQHYRVKWPLLIDYYSNTSSYTQYQSIDTDVMLHQFNDEHFLPEPFLKALKNALL
ncbi:MAG: hypothetical protein IPH45_00165 [Bacteroidales bacterium]|nr:hypothetical protein [Bacteroidales bacterium]